MPLMEPLHLTVDRSYIGRGKKASPPARRHRKRHQSARRSGTGVIVGKIVQVGKIEEIKNVNLFFQGLLNRQKIGMFFAIAEH